MQRDGKATNHKTKKQGFIVTMDEAAEIKFNLDVIKREANRLDGPNSNITRCCTQICRTLNKAKAEHTVTLRE